MLHENDRPALVVARPYSAKLTRLRNDKSDVTVVCGCACGCGLWFVVSDCCCCCWFPIVVAAVGL